MIHLDRSHLLIGLLGVILAVLVIQIVMDEASDVKEVFQEERTCYLTFDDGPSYNTEKVLDILEKYDIKATFFVVGEELTEERSGIVERLIEEGHTIGMHANRHVYEELYASKESFQKDYEILDRKLQEDYGINAKLFRFPGGSVCTCLNGQGKEYIAEMEKLGLSCFDWNVSGEDAVGSPTVASIQKKVLDRGLECRRAIVLLHDSAIADKTVEALPGIIEKFREAGFSFDTLENTESYIFPDSREELK